MRVGIELSWPCIISCVFFCESSTTVLDFTIAGIAQPVESLSRFESMKSAGLYN